MQPKLFRSKLRIVKKALPDNIDILFISAFGSWNYGLQTSTSDIDFKTVYIPKLDELIHPLYQSSSIIEVGNIGQCEAISVQSFVDKIKSFDISKIEILFACNIWVNDKHKQLFDSIKEQTLNLILNNKVRYIDSVISVCSSIYRTFITNSVFKYNGKKAYNIPRLKYLLNEVVFNNTYSLMIEDDEDIHNHIMAYKVGNIEKDDAEIECRIIIERMKTMKTEFTNETEDRFQNRCDELDAVVKNAIYTEIVRANEEMRIRKKVKKVSNQCRSDIAFHMTLSFITLWLQVTAMIVMCVIR